MVSDIQLHQYFQLVKDVPLKEVVREPLIHSAYYANQNLPTIQSLDTKLMQLLCT